MKSGTLVSRPNIYPPWSYPTDCCSSVTHQVGCITYDRSGYTPSWFVCTAKWQSVGLASPFFPAALQEHHFGREGLSHLYFETGTMSYLSWRRKVVVSHTLWSSLIPISPTQGCFHGYTRPLNAFMKMYILLSIIPACAARHRSIQGFKTNGHIIQFKNCDANPNSYFAFIPNHNRQTPSSYHSNNLIYEKVGESVDWRSKAISIPHRTSSSSCNWQSCILEAVEPTPPVTVGASLAFAPPPLEFAKSLLFPSHL